MTLIGFLTAGVATLVFAAATTPEAAQQRAAKSPIVGLAASPEAIYSNDPNDSWNRIFYYLFSRRLITRMAPDFPEAAPFAEVQGLVQSTPLQASTRTFERNETGDRAIDPLYPSFISVPGLFLILTDPTYQKFRKSLEDAREDNSQRSTVARAMMQNDLWSAYDIIYRYKHLKESGESDFANHRLEVLGLLGRVIRKIALRPDEIQSLPDDYSTARSKFPLPDLFGRDSDWLEVQWFPQRLHDESVDYRRVTRVFLKPAKPPQDLQKFLNNFRREYQDPVIQLAGVALITQPLMIDDRGRLSSSKLSTDVQFRMFEKSAQGTFLKTTIGIYEISRKNLLNRPESGGMIEERDTAMVYLPSAGNDYTFASTLSGTIDPSTPIAVRARTRCAFCHGDKNLTVLMTFSMKVAPNEDPGPPVRQLNPALHEAADFVISEKSKSENWISLGVFFQK